MLGLIQWLLLALLAVQAVCGASGPTTWHLVHDQREIRQCTHVWHKLGTFNRNRACVSTIQTGPNDMACIAAGRNEFSTMNRFAVACNQAEGKLVDAPTGKSFVFSYSKKFVHYLSNYAAADLVYSSFSFDTELCYGPAQNFASYSWRLTCKDAKGFEAACKKAGGNFIVNTTPPPWMEGAG
ncbi:hypothetical protein ACQY0O_001122 [Thecaphora frezii]